MDLTIHRIPKQIPWPSVYVWTRKSSNLKGPYIFKRIPWPTVFVLTGNHLLRHLETGQIASGGEQGKGSSEERGEQEGCW